jgi:hypothetical protein
MTKILFYLGLDILLLVVGWLVLYHLIVSSAGEYVK